MTANEYAQWILEVHPKNVGIKVTGIRIEGLSAYLTCSDGVVRSFHGLFAVELRKLMEAPSDPNHGPG